MRTASNATACGLRPSAGKARRLLFVALFAASCSYDAYNPDVFVHVDGIQQAADHLEVIVTPSDTTVTGKNNCAQTTTVPPSATCYRPSFAPVDDTAALRSIDLAFVAPARTGTVTVQITAYDRDQHPHGAGSTAPAALPGPVNLQLTLQ